MIKDLSETKSDLTCEECGEPIKQNQIDNKPIYCEFCGALNSSVDSQHPEKSQLEQERIRFSYTTQELSQEIRNLIYQKIYELMKANFSIMSRLKHLEDLKQSQILKLVKKLRRALLFLSLPSNSTELLTKTSKKKIENYFEDFQASLKKKKKNQSSYLPYLIKNIKFIYRLIKGDFEFSTLAKYNQKAVKKLKTKYGFKINPKNINSFSYSLSILLCRKIYKIITAQGHVLDLKHSKNELTKQYILNTAKDITALILNNNFKQNFSKAYRELKKDLEIDWVYRESFIEHVCSLIKLIYKLAYNNGYSSRLRGFQKLVAESLKESRFFEDNTTFSPYFKVNLALILSRIIHYALESSQNLTPLQSDPRKLNKTDNLRVATEILDELLADKKIKSEFLKQFYNFSLEKFQEEYENLQAKLKSDMIYKENFLSFIKKLTNTVYKITHTRSKKSSHSKIELGIIKDLANYNFNWESFKKEKSCFYSEEKNKSYDIFTTEIPENSLLWRVRAYIIGLLLADGNIHKNKFSISQHKKDYDLLLIAQMALGGKIKHVGDKIFRLYQTNKNLVEQLTRYGMVERHSKKEVAKFLQIPDYIIKKINFITLIRDFVRGFYDGDGWFISTSSNVMMFGINGSQNFLESIKEKILLEIPNLSINIYPSFRRVYIEGTKKYFVFSKNRIYIPGFGEHLLESEDLEKGKIVREQHPWLKRMHIAGKYNCIKFFNWLYSNNDFFDTIKIDGIHLCGKRKFQKALNSLGDYNKRKEILAPIWKDSLRNIVQILENRFYTSKELMVLTNNCLMNMLKDLKLLKLYQKNKINNVSDFNRELKKIELLEGSLISYQTRLGRSNVNYYFSTAYTLSKIPDNYHRKIDLITRKGNPKKILKNLIIHLFISNNKGYEFKELIEILNDYNIFNPTTLRPNRIILDIAELKNFDIIIEDDKDIELYEHRFVLNISLLPKYYKMELNKLKKELEKLFKYKKNL